ncbi:MAG: 30S ribosomal protein S15 [Acidobacteriota bacterium]
MPATAEAKKQTITKYQRHGKDTASPEVQVALLTGRIEELTTHFGKHVKDHHGRRGLLKLVGRRRSLLAYLKREDEARYKKLIQDLGIRR